MKKRYSFLIALVVGVLCFWAVVYFNQPTVIAPETPAEEEFAGYQGEPLVAGIWENVTLKSAIEPDTLVLYQRLAERTDYFFLPAALWERYGDVSSFLPGETVSMNGSIQYLGTTAGDQYYQVVALHQLEIL